MVKVQAAWSICDERLCDHLERDENGGWGAYLPDLPGVVALGATREEVSDLIREAVDAHSQENGGTRRRLPDPMVATGTIQAA
jgi:predicted RNase H-like HicB family nuclease